MECKDIHDKIYDYIEQQLSKEEATKFEEHMKKCNFCQEEYYKIEKIIIKLKNIKDVEPPKYLKDNILEKIKKEEKNKFKLLKTKKYCYAATTVSIIIGGAYALKAYDNTKNSLYNVDGAREVQEYNMKNGRAIKEVTEICTDAVDSSSYSFKYLDGEEPYLYEKELKKEDEIDLFKHEILLYKDKVLKIYFENKSNDEIKLYVEDINENKVVNEILLDEIEREEIEISIDDENIEKNLYTINIEGDNIEGHLKIEIVDKKIPKK